MASKRVLNDWKKRMLPFIEKHRNEDARSDKGYYGGVDEGSRCVKFDNYEGFVMNASLSFSKEVDSNFEYVRKVEPIEGSARRNDNFNGDIVSAWKDCFDAEGFDVGLTRARAYGFSGVGVEGRGGAEMFDSYINLVRLLDGFVDLKLKRFDQTRERPFRYAVLEKAHSGSCKLNYFKEIEDLPDLENAESVLVLAKEMKRYYDEENPVSNINRVLEDVARTHEGKVLSVSEFLKSR